jgi:hypothetical protein
MTAAPETIVRELELLSQTIAAAPNPSLDELAPLFSLRDGLVRQLAAAAQGSVSPSLLPALETAVRAGDVARQKLVATRRFLLEEWQRANHFRSALGSPCDPAPEGAHISVEF